MDAYGTRGKVQVGQGFGSIRMWRKKCNGNGQSPDHFHGDPVSLYREMFLGAGPRCYPVPRDKTSGAVLQGNEKPN